MTKALAQARSCDPGGTKNYNKGTVTPLTEKVESVKCHSDVTSGSLGKKNKTHVIVPPTGKQRSNC